jgi:hypothetical protein
MTKKELAYRSNLVDELGAIESKLLAKLAAMAPDEAIADAHRRTIEAWTADVPAEQAIVYGGKLYSVMCTARKNDRTLDTDKLQKAVGDTRYLEVATVTLGAFDLLVKEFPEASAAVTKERTGKRTITVFLKAA